METVPKENCTERTALEKSTIYALIAVACWSTVATAFKLGLQYLTPLSLVLWSLVFACGFLTSVAWLQKLPLLSIYRQSPWRYWLMGALNPGIYYPVLFLAYDKLPAQQAQSINYSWALMLVVMSAIFLREKVSVKDWLACAVGYIGVIFIATGGDLTALHFESPIGVMLAVASTIVWASYWIISRQTQSHPLATMTLNFMCGLPVVIIACVLLETVELPDWRGLLVAGYIGLMEMALTFVLWLKALQLTKNTARTSNLIYLSPFISLLLIYQVLGEAIQQETIIGLIIILMAVVVQQKQNKSTDNEIMEKSGR